MLICSLSVHGCLHRVVVLCGGKNASVAQISEAPQGSPVQSWHVNKFNIHELLGVCVVSYITLYIYIYIYIYIDISMYIYVYIYIYI